MPILQRGVTEHHLYDIFMLADVLESERVAVVTSDKTSSLSCIVLLSWGSFLNQLIKIA
jgi:hypothetical protein